MSYGWLTAILLFLAVGLSFLLAGMEAGMFAISPPRLRHWMRKGLPGAAGLYRLLQQPETFLWTTLVGNTLAVFSWVALLTWFLLEWFSRYPAIALVLFLLLTTALYVVCDLLPKMLFRGHPDRLCLKCVTLIQVIHALLRPVAAVFQTMARLIAPRAGATGPLHRGREELRQTLQELDPSVTGEERAMIVRVLDLEAMRIGQLAVPMTKVASVNETEPVETVLRLFRESQLSRIPVWRGPPGPRRIVGVVSIRRLLYGREVDPDRPVSEHVQPALFVPFSLTVDDVLRRMQRSGQRIAVILGADRREMGVATREDILRFMFGGPPG